MALTKLNNNGIAGVTALPSSIALGDMTLVSSATASSSASLTFTLADYKEYQFYFVNIHAATSGAEYQFNLSIDSGSNYNVAKTSTAFESYHMEDDSGSGLVYQGNADLAQGTGDQQLFRNLSTDNDCSYSGYLKLFNPSSDTFVKNYIARGNGFNTTPLSDDFNVAGYGNTTSAVNRIIFRMSSGNIDSGTILMYGIN
jgi:hypothetical protein